MKSTWGRSAVRDRTEAEVRSRPGRSTTRRGSIMRKVRAPSDDLSQVSLWSAPDTHPGIAHGWHGVAWLWLALVRAGLAPERRPTLLAIRERIRGSERPGGGTGLFVGRAGRPLVRGQRGAAGGGGARVAHRSGGARARRARGGRVGRGGGPSAAARRD